MLYGVCIKTYLTTVLISMICMVLERTNYVLGIYCRSVHHIYMSLDLNPGIELV